MFFPEFYLFHRCGVRKKKKKVKVSLHFAIPRPLTPVPKPDQGWCLVSLHQRWREGPGPLGEVEVLPHFAVPPSPLSVLYPCLFDPSKQLPYLVHLHGPSTRRPVSAG
jgi:hypothetical protein